MKFGFLSSIREGKRGKKGEKKCTAVLIIAEGGGGREEKFPSPFNRSYLKACKYKEDEREKKISLVSPGSSKRREGDFISPETWKRKTTRLGDRATP